MAAAHPGAAAAREASAASALWAAERDREDESGGGDAAKIEHLQRHFNGGGGERTHVTDVSQAPPDIVKLARAAEGAAARLASASLRVPRNGTEFETSWHALRDQPSVRRLQFLALVPPEAVPRLFKDASLNGAILSGVLRCALGEWFAVDPVRVAAWLSALTTVPRFDTCVMFLSGATKHELSVTWDAAAASGHAPALAAIRHKYKL